MASSYKPLSYREQVTIICDLFTAYGVEESTDNIKDVIASVGFETFKYYLADIGVLFNISKLGINISASTVNDDQEWIKAKITTAWSRMVTL